jgi:predicted transcriptional regulator
MNIPMTSIAEALVREIMTFGYDSPEIVIEEALQSFHSQKLIRQVDTTLGFSGLTETEILQENEHRWQTFQQTGQSIPQDQVEAWVKRLGVENHTNV